MKEIPGFLNTDTPFLIPYTSGHIPYFRLVVTAFFIPFPIVALHSFAI